MKEKKKTVGEQERNPGTGREHGKEGQCVGT